MGGHWWQGCGAHGTHGEAWGGMGRHGAHGAHGIARDAWVHGAHGAHGRHGADGGHEVVPRVGPRPLVWMTTSCMALTVPLGFCTCISDYSIAPFWLQHYPILTTAVPHSSRVPGLQATACLARVLCHLQATVLPHWPTVLSSFSARN